MKRISRVANLKFQALKLEPQTSTWSEKKDLLKTFCQKEFMFRDISFIFVFTFYCFFFHFFGLVFFSVYIKIVLEKWNNNLHELYNLRWLIERYNNHAFYLLLYSAPMIRHSFFLMPKPSRRVFIYLFIFFFFTKKRKFHATRHRL